MSEAEIRDEQVQNPQVAYERRDLSARGVLGFLIGLAVAGVLILIVIWGMYEYLDRFQAQHQPPGLSPLAAQEQGPTESAQRAQRFPQPRLQPDPVADLNKFRTQEEELLNRYGWVDQKAGTVRIPIERAMELVAQHGLPTRPPPNLPPAAQSGAGGPGPGQAAGTLPAPRQ